MAPYFVTLKPHYTMLPLESAEWNDLPPNFKRKVCDLGLISSLGPPFFKVEVAK